MKLRVSSLRSCGHARRSELSHPGWHDVRVISCKRARDLSVGPVTQLRASMYGVVAGSGMDGAALSHFSRSYSPRLRKKTGRDERVTSPVSPRNTAKLCIRSKERNLRQFAPFSPPAIILLCVFNFCARTYTDRETRAARRSLILSYVLFDNLSCFFPFTVVPSFKDYPGWTTLILNSTTPEETLRTLRKNNIIHAHHSRSAVSKTTHYKGV